MKSNNGIGWLIGIVLFFFFFRFLLGGLFFFLAIGWMIYHALKQLKRGERRINLKMSRVLSNEEVRRLNSALATFFSTRDKLVIRDTVFLRPSGTKFTDIDDLYLYFGDEAISTFGGLGQTHRSDYRQMIRDIETAVGLSHIASESGVAASQGTAPSPVTAETATRAQKFIDEIDRLNEHIPDPQISEGLNETVRLLKPLGLVEAKLTSHSVKLDKLYEYYLPILTSILRQYDDLSKRDFGSKDFLAAKEKLSKTISLINEALRNINHSFSEVALMDMSTDIFTLQTILKKDGMVDDAISMRNMAEKREAERTRTDVAADGLETEAQAAEQSAPTVTPTLTAPIVANVDDLAQELEDDELIEKNEPLLGRQS